MHDAPSTPRSPLLSGAEIRARILPHGRVPIPGLPALRERERARDHTERAKILYARLREATGDPALAHECERERAALARVLRNGAWMEQDHIEHVRAEYPALIADLCARVEHAERDRPVDVPGGIRANTDRRIDDLTPDTPPSRAPGERPQLFLIGGQTAAGKTTAQEHILWSMPDGSVASYDGDDNVEVHPRMADLMRGHGKAGHVRVGEEVHDAGCDVHGELLAHLRGEYGGHQYDVLASHPLGRQRWARAWFEDFAREGYETTVLFVATHASNSRTDLVHRYRRGVDDPVIGYGRWVDPDLHEEFYSNGPDIADALEREGVVDHALVLSRSGEVLHENHRTPAGGWERSSGARAAVLAERARTKRPDAW